MKIVVEVKEKHGEDLCKCYEIILSEEDILSLAEVKAFKMKLLTKQTLFDSEILHIVP